MAGEKIDPSRLASVSVYLLERNNEIANSLRTMLRNIGLAGVKTFGSPDELEAALATTMADVLILSENKDANIFEVTKRIRNAVVGKNPFTIILLLIAPGDNKASIEAAVKSGADSALMKPVASNQLVERVTQMAYNRLPFIATTDYIGPERRGSNRPSDIPLIHTINTLRYKVEKKNIAPETLDKAIASTTNQLWFGQLKSQSLKLQWSCTKIFDMLRDKRPPEDVKASLLELVAVLADATQTAKRIGRPEMVKTCHELAIEIQAIAAASETLEEAKIKAISRIAAAFELARQSISPPPPPPE